MMRFPCAAVRALVGLLALVSIALPRLAADWDRPPVTDRELAQGYRDDVVLAKPAAAHRATAAVEEGQEGRSPRRVFKEFDDIRVLPVLPGETAVQAVERLRATGRYEVVDFDHLRRALALPNDPGLPQQWHLANTADNSPASGPGITAADIHAASAWDIRHDASSIIVGIVDTGARLTHSDLVANLWTNPTAGKDGFIGDLHGIDATVSASTAAGGNPNDTSSVGHGTHVSGIIGAVGNNGNLLSGIAWKVQLMPLKFIPASGYGSTTGSDHLPQLRPLPWGQNHQCQLRRKPAGSE